VTLLIFAGVAFFGLGGVGLTKGFFDSLKLPRAFAESGSSGSPSLSPTILQTSVSSKRNSLQGKETIRTGIITDPNRAEARLLTQVGAKGVSQFSDGSIGILSEQQRQEIANREFTKQELEDIKKLDARRQSAIERGINPNIKRSGRELVLAKREQEALSKQFLTKRFGAGTFFKGKLFANPNFGAPSNDPRNLSKAERAEIERNKILNALRRDEQLRSGSRLRADIQKSGLTDKAFLKAKGINLNTSNLSPRALGRLRELGLL
jgi:hypothetical protein